MTLGHLKPQATDSDHPTGFGRSHVRRKPPRIVREPTISCFLGLQACRTAGVSLSILWNVSHALSNLPSSTSLRLTVRRGPGYQILKYKILNEKRDRPNWAASHPPVISRKTLKRLPYSYIFDVSPQTDSSCSEESRHLISKAKAGWLL